MCSLNEPFSLEKMRGWEEREKTSFWLNLTFKKLGDFFVSKTKERQTDESDQTHHRRFEFYLSVKLGQDWVNPDLVFDSSPSLRPFPEEG